MVMGFPGWERAGVMGSCGAVSLLTRIATRRGTPQAYAELAQVELSAKEPKQALAHLEEALRLGPRPRFPMELQYARALQAAGRKADALAAWQRLESSASTPEEISQVAGGAEELGV